MLIRAEFYKWDLRVGFYTNGNFYQIGGNETLIQSPSESCAAGWIIRGRGGRYNLTIRPYPLGFPTVEQSPFRPFYHLPFFRRGGIFRILWTACPAGH